jgi:hypothetical protein
VPPPITVVMQDADAPVACDNELINAVAIQITDAPDGIIVLAEIPSINPSRVRVDLQRSE